MTDAFDDADVYEEEEEEDNDDDAAASIATATEDEQLHDEGTQISDELTDETPNAATHCDVIVIKPEDRRTSHVLSKFEITSIISTRATQIAKYNNPMIAIGNLDDPAKIARAELEQRKVPLVLRRQVGEVKAGKKVIKYFELWNPNEMTFTL